MKTCIFTKKFDSLINDTLPHAERKLLAAHLGEECEVCEKFLREADEEKRITLFALLENDRQQKSQEFAYNEAKKNAILRTIISQKELSSFASLIQKILANSTRPALTAVLIGVFALSFVFIYLKKEIHEVSYTGIKGTQTSPITLTAQFGTMNGKDRKIQGFVENNMSLSRAHDLFFSFQLKTTGYLYLVEKAQNHTKLIYLQMCKALQ